MTNEGADDNNQSLNDNKEPEQPLTSNAVVNSIQPFDPPTPENEFDTSKTSTKTTFDPPPS